MTAPTTPSPERQPADAGGVVRELAMQLAKSIASLGYPVGMGVAPPEDACMKAAQGIIDIYGPALSTPAPQAQPDARAVEGEVLREALEDAISLLWDHVPGIEPRIVRLEESLAASSPSPAQGGYDGYVKVFYERDQ